MDACAKKNICFIGMILALLLLAVRCLSTPALAVEDDTINILINGKAVVFTNDSGHPYVDENSRTMVPLRVTMEAAGAAVGYDSEKQTAIVITEHDRIEVPIGTDYLYNNNIKIQNDTISTAKEGRTYLPIRAVLESAGFTVEWDGATRTVNAYTFDLSESFVPYSTDDIWTLLDNLLEGNIVYANGQYYATPDYVKMLGNTQVTYTGDDLNKAVYPQESRYDLATTELQTATKEWVSEKDLGAVNVTFSSFPIKGFYGGLMGRCLHSMPSLPDDFAECPVGGTYDGIAIKVENGEILFYQEDLLTCNVLSEKITEIKAVQP